MNNRKKAIVSAVAGAALLAGTGATFALWRDTAELAGSAGSNVSINIGHLFFEDGLRAGLTSSQTVVFNNDPSLTHLDLWVPEDTATWTVKLDVPDADYFVAADGDFMEYEVKVLGESVELGLAVDVNNGVESNSFEINGVTGLWSLEFDVPPITIEDANGTVEASVTLTFETGTLNRQEEFTNDIQVLSANSDLKLTFVVTQVR